MVKEVTQLDEYKQITQGSQPVAVDFYATWCGPCKMIGPKFVDLAKQYEGKITFLKVDVDKASDVS